LGLVNVSLKGQINKGLGVLGLGDPVALRQPLCSDCAYARFCRYDLYLSELEVRLREVKRRLPKATFEIRFVPCKHFRKEAAKGRIYKNQ